MSGSACLYLLEAHLQLDPHASTQPKTGFLAQQMAKYRKYVGTRPPFALRRQLRVYGSISGLYQWPLRTLRKQIPYFLYGALEGI